MYLTDIFVCVVSRNTAIVYICTYVAKDTGGVY